jgi:hypothetical protein
LELHCRQKAWDVQPEQDQDLVVATLQQDIYPQLIHKLTQEILDNLWVICGSPSFDDLASRIVVFDLLDMPKRIGQQGNST